MEQGRQSAEGSADEGKILLVTADARVAESAGLAPNESSPRVAYL
ncbi:MAG TPA: hypothetical protein VGI60_03345 [Chthoniobacterales bacterium]